MAATQGEDEFNGDIIVDAFKLKPIIVPAECTGDISITASIQDLSTPEQLFTDKHSSSIGASINFATICIKADGNTELEFDYQTTTATTFPSATVTDVSDLDNLEFIPAFYQVGYLTVAYTVGESEDVGNAFDIIWDLKMSLPDAQTDCPWSEGNYAYDSQIMKNIIRSDRSEANFPAVAEYTSLTQTFTIDTWSQIPPFVIKEFIDEPATTIMVKRAVLTPPKFKLIAKNNLNSEVTLSNAVCKFQWFFNPMDIFMNMRTEGNRRKKQARIYTLPKGSEATRIASLDFPIYAVVDGYKVGPPQEIVKVFGTWNEYHQEGDYYFPTTIELLPVEGMSGTDYPICLYKSNGGVLKRDDFIRITDGGWMNGDGITVLDAPKIAADEHYRTINVKIQDDKSPDDPDAIFEITTTPNTSIDDQVTEDELVSNISKIHFFNKIIDFATTTTIARRDIDPMFYETLWQTYDKAVVLESIAEEPLHYINFSINDYPKVVPIYNGQRLMFSDSLNHAMDGVRSGEIFHIDGTTPNIINIQCPTKHKYKVKFKVDYEVYKDIYVITDGDIPN